MTVSEGFKDMIAIIDYNAGNITSVARALHSIGQEYIITDDTKMLDSASHVIFPGVGAAGEAMAYLKQKNLHAWLKTCFQGGKPILGICLGTQIILDYSEENHTDCIGLIAGSTKRFPDQSNISWPGSENSAHGLEQRKLQTGASGVCRCPSGRILFCAFLLSVHRKMVRRFWEQLITASPFARCWR